MLMTHLFGSLYQCILDHIDINSHQFYPDIDLLHCMSSQRSHLYLKREEMILKKCLRGCVI